MPPPASPEALPAPATLASTLLSNIEGQRPNHISVGTGCKQLDDILDGGFRYGEITGLAIASASATAGGGEGGGSGVGAVGRNVSRLLLERLLTLGSRFRERVFFVLEGSQRKETDISSSLHIPLQALATHLLASTSSSRVAYMDTSGNFSPLQLYKTILSRLRPTSHHLNHRGFMYSRLEHQDDAEKKGLEERAKTVLNRVLLMRVFDFVGIVEAVGEIGASLEMKGGGAGKEAIEELGGGLNQEGVEELGPGKRRGEDTNEKSPEGRVGMIIIDSMTNVVSSMMSKDHVQGHALLTTFLRTLHHLTRTHHLGTILLNSAVATQPSLPSGRQLHTNIDNNVSIFAATLGKPALGKTYAYLLDTSLFLSSGQKGEDGLVGREDDTVVLEMLYDRFGRREGRWVALRVDHGSVELRSAF